MIMVGLIRIDHGKVKLERIVFAKIKKGRIKHPSYI